LYRFGIAHYFFLFTEKLYPTKERENSLKYFIYRIGYSAEVEPIIVMFLPSFLSKSISENNGGKLAILTGFGLNK
jgi:hypothetical protein